MNYASNAFVENWNYPYKLKQRNLSIEMDENWPSEDLLTFGPNSPTAASFSQRTDLVPKTFEFIFPDENIETLSTAPSR
jgi:hypothetical protein